MGKKKDQIALRQAQASERIATALEMLAQAFIPEHFANTQYQAGLDYYHESREFKGGMAEKKDMLERSEGVELP